MKKILLTGVGVAVAFAGLASKVIHERHSNPEALPTGFVQVPPAQQASLASPAPAIIAPGMVVTEPSVTANTEFAAPASKVMTRPAVSLRVPASIMPEKDNMEEAAESLPAPPYLEPELRTEGNLGGPPLLPDAGLNTPQ